MEGRQLRAPPREAHSLDAEEPVRSAGVDVGGQAVEADKGKSEDGHPDHQLPGRQLNSVLGLEFFDSEIGAVQWILLGVRKHSQG